MNKTNSSQADFDYLRKLAEKCFYHCEAFTNFFMKDDPSANFTVPTRQHMVVDNIPPFQAEIFSHLTDLWKTGRLALASPRSFMKSTTCSVEFPLWAAANGHFREILIVSNSEALAVNFLRSIKVNFESNERIIRMYGKLWSDKWTENHIILKNGVSIRAVGWGAQIRGFRPDLIIMDDIESDETVISEDTRKKMRDWILKAAINSLRVDGCMVWVGTLINRVALIYDWMHSPPVGWKTIFNQAYRGGIEEAGRELWPEVWPHARLQARKAEIGSAAFSSEFLNDPIPPDGNAFNPAKLRYFDDDKMPKEYGVYIAIDPAFSESSDADYGVIMVALHDGADNLYIQTYHRDKTNSDVLIQQFERLYRHYNSRVRAVGVESVGPQKHFYDTLEKEMNAKGLYPPFKKLTGMIQTAKGLSHKKEQRIIFSIQPRLESGKLFVKSEQLELINELTLFSESGNKHDDLCDALSYIISMVQPFNDYSGTQEHFSFENEPVYESRGVSGYQDPYAQEEEFSFN